MRIGIDLDNTIVCYDHVVHRAAVARGLVPTDLPVSKGAVRDYLRRCGHENTWIELQGYVYGSGMADAATGQIRLTRSLLARRILSGGTENAASISYTRRALG